MKALLDACVLFPTILREILTDVAGAGLYAPLWSEHILSEWQHAAARLGPDQAAVSGAEVALLKLRFPEAMVAAGDEAALGVSLPDPGDLHVLRAAMDAKAEAIVTMNLRDFPRRALAPFGLHAVHPDEFLTGLARQDCEPVRRAVDAALRRAQAAGGQFSEAEMLARARLPRLRKFLNLRPDPAAAQG